MKLRMILIAITLIMILIFLGYNLKQDSKRRHLVLMIEGIPVSPLKHLEITYAFREGAITIHDSESMRYLQSLKYSAGQVAVQFNGPHYYTYFVFEDGTRVWGGIWLIANVSPGNIPENRKFFLISYPLDELGDPEYYTARLSDPVPANLKRVFDALVQGKLPTM